MSIAVAGVRAAEYVGYRRCPARADYVELVVRVAGARLNWCLPGVIADLPGDVGGVVELQWHRAGLRIVERCPDGEVEVIGASRAVALLEAGGPLFVDERAMRLRA